MANFLAGLSAEAQVPVVLVGEPPLICDPEFTHWVVAEGQILGEARDVEPDQNGSCFAYVRLFKMPQGAEYGRLEKQYLQPKAAHAAGEGSVEGGAP